LQLLILDCFLLELVAFISCFGMEDVAIACKR